MKRTQLTNILLGGNTTATSLKAAKTINYVDTDSIVEELGFNDNWYKTGGETEESLEQEFQADKRYREEAIKEAKQELNARLGIIDETYNKELHAETMNQCYLEDLEKQEFDNQTSKEIYDEEKQEVLEIMNFILQPAM